MSDGDDWFERALRDLEDDERGVEGELSAEDNDQGVDDDERGVDEKRSVGEDATAVGNDDAPDDPDAPDENDSAAGVSGTSEPQTGADPDDAFDGASDGDPFGGGGEADTFGNDGEADPFGGVAGGGRERQFGGPSSREDGPDFDPTDFQNLGEAGGFGEEEFGPGAAGDAFDVGPGGEPAFDEEAFDSDIDRIDVGITGLDEMILGGVPERSLMVAIGSAGTGKTTFGLQFLTEALREDGTGVYITLEESREAILSTAEEKGWPFREWCEAERLAVVALDPIEMANSLSSIRNDISRLVTEFGADRLVLDSVSLLEMMYDDPATRRSEVYDFARSLKEAGVTTMLTSEASEDNPYTSRYGIVEYLVDAVFVLQYVRPSNFRETRLAVEIQKIRDANHSRETKPYEITNSGISVYRQANIF